MRQRLLRAMLPCTMVTTVCPNTFAFGMAHTRTYHVTYTCLYVAICGPYSLTHVLNHSHTHTCARARMDARTLTRSFGAYKHYRNLKLRPLYEVKFIKPFVGHDSGHILILKLSCLLIRHNLKTYY